MEGPSDTVVSLTERNSDIPFEAAGDPVNERTAASLAEFEALLRGELAWTPELTEKLSRNERLVASFIAAVDAIARGESPLLSTNTSQSNDFESSTDLGLFDYAGVDVYYLEAIKGSVLTGIDLAIPLTCKSMEMRPVDQLQGKGEDRIYTTARIPDCVFSSKRESGIFYDDDATGSTQLRAEITAYLRAFSSRPDATQQGISLLIGNESFTVLSIPAKVRDLARDRDDWKFGRTISGIRAIQFGTTEITVGRVVLASGGEGLVELSLNDTVADRTTEYVLVGEIDGDCPPFPAGSAGQGSECLSVTTLRCFTFPEDYLSKRVDSIPEVTDCNVNRVEIIWGNNFEVDEQLVAAVAGVYGRNKKNARSDRQELLLALNSVPAALFTLGSMDMRTSKMQTVSPSINEVYISFMLLPIIVALASFFIAYKMREECLPIPENCWHLMVLGSEENVVPARNSSREKYPEIDKRLRFGVVANDKDGFDLGVWSPHSINSDPHFAQQQSTGSVESGVVDNESGTKQPSVSDKNSSKDRTGSTEFLNDYSVGQEIRNPTADPVGRYAVSPSVIRSI